MHQTYQVVWSVDVFERENTTPSPVSYQYNRLLQNLHYTCSVFTIHVSFAFQIRDFIFDIQRKFDNKQ